MDLNAPRAGGSERGAQAAGGAGGADVARHAIGGVAPRRVARPATREEAAGVLREAAREGLAVVPWGGGVALPHEAAPQRYDLALDLGALDRIVAYDPEDLTITAECGVTVAALRAALAAHGQELPLEAPHAARATLGGALAANASGPRRLRFGAPRDRILGARYALGDGTLARSGGSVVKNVAGYGLHRMMCGSRGGLAAIVEASLKLMPAPAARVALVYAADAAALAEAGRWAALPGLEPAALTVAPRDAAPGGAPHGDGFAVTVALEDDAAWVAEQERRVTAALGAPALRLEGAAARALLEDLADLEETPGPRLTFATSGNTPAALVAALGPLAGARLVFHAPAGRLHALGAVADAREAVLALARAGFALLDARGAGEVPPAPAPFAALRALRARVRDAVDPGGRFALGERWVASG
uniref:FAD-binding oxidoreductase n=1 Tax=Eiseniibacteriota bacterium TaxID=2212470 RepID=A0A832I285_UNCEI